VRNVLADPYVLGVTSGASMGAAAAILFGVGAALGAQSLAATAFLGALVASSAVLAVACIGGPVTSVKLLLSGVAIGYLLHAATSFLVFASDSPEGTRAVMFWLLGSLAQARWSSLGVAGVVTGGALVALAATARRLDAIALGDDTARAIGTDPSRLRVRVLCTTSLLVGAVVAVSGGIGFVGLVVPHLARRAVGGAHRHLLPAAALLGATFLVWSDVLARLLMRPRELPLGVVTALAGGPFLLHHVRRLHAGGA
jgi:iron complex transport system permease protein